MILSRKFVSDYVEIPTDIKTLAEDMTNIGNEYDSCGKLIPATNLVIGEVLECIDHPDSDHLHVCQVEIKDKTIQIVCGAPNVRKGLKVIVALDGAELPGGTIKKGVIRGQESNGMLCSIAELGLDHKFLTEKDVEGIHELPNDAVVGEDPIKYLELDDEVIDFELTSNRGDLLSALGLAYEIGSLYSKNVKEVELNYNENELENIKDSFKVEVKTEKCPLFLAKKVTNITIKESPTFIKNRLIACGIRPINNVVDISNYVMLELGQPLHYYDASRLGDTLIVRQAENNEKLTTLDNQERELTEADIVIANNNGAVGLAGVMGGLSTEVEDTTTEIIIESAIFDATSVRKTSKKVLRSEASNRFEKGLDPKRTYMAIERSCNLLEKYADAKITSGMIEYNHIDMSDKKIEITYEKINSILGIIVEPDEVKSIFKRLNFEIEEKDEKTLIVIAPTRRMDISIKEDLIEEIGRIYGIDNIVGKKLVLKIKPGKNDKTIRQLKNKLCDLGLNETLTYSLISEQESKMFEEKDIELIKLLDPMTEERNTLRHSLIPSLLSVYNYNKSRNNKDISIFEIGRGYFLQEEYKEETKLAVLMSGNYYEGLDKQNVDFYIIKGIMEETLEYLGYTNRYSIKPTKEISELHPGQSAEIIVNNQKVGLIGKLHPNITKENIYVMEINLSKLLQIRTQSMKYKEISKYPKIEKDLAFIVDKSVTSESIIANIKRAGGKLLTNIVLFDVYTGENVGENEKSLAYTLTFEDTTKTLSDEEVTEVFKKIINEVETKQKAKLRDK